MCHGPGGGVLCVVVVVVLGLCVPDGRGPMCHKCDGGGAVLFCIGGGVVVGGLEPLGEWLCVGTSLCCQPVVTWRGFEGLGEQVGGEGGTVGIPCGSPLLCSCSSVVAQHTSYPLFKGRRAVVVGLLSG
jgi:hypothetical protein